MINDLILLGDIALNGLFVSDKKNNYKRFEQILPIFENDSFTIANLEMPIRAGSELNPEKNIHFYTEEDVVSEVLPLLNIRLLSLANNHIGDFGLPGVKKTIEVLDRLGIRHTGAGYKSEHIEPVTFVLNNLKVGFLAYVDRNTNPKTDKIDGIYINYFNEEDVIREIEKLKSKVDRIILSIHWGIDYSYYPTKLQIDISHRLIDSGVDIILGHHTHTLQPFEKYNEGLIFYSLGGFCFGDHIEKGKMKALPMKTKKTGIPLVTISRSISLHTITAIKELKGNKLIITKKNIQKWSHKRWKILQLSSKVAWLSNILHFKESYLDRIIEFLFGYYKNPYKRLFLLFDYKRIAILISDSILKKSRSL